MLVDTDVMIWHLRGHHGARRFLQELPRILISAVTYLELVQGMRNRRELMVLRRSLKGRGIAVLPVDERICDRTVLYVEEHFLSHALRLADALIAATALEHGLPLATANVKHYHVIQELDLVRFVP